MHSYNYLSGKREYPNFFCQGNQLYIADTFAQLEEHFQKFSETDMVLPSAYGHIVEIDFKIVLDNAELLLQNNLSISRILEVREMETTEDESQSYSVYMKSDADGLLGTIKLCAAQDRVYCKITDAATDDSVKNAASLVVAAVKFICELESDEVKKCVLMLPLGKVYDGVANVIKSFTSDYFYIEYLNLNLHESENHELDCQLRRDLMSYLAYEDIDLETTDRIISAICNSNHLREKMGFEPIYLQDLKHIVDADTMTSVDDINELFRIVSPVQDADTWEVFEELFPAEFDYRKNNDLILGVLNEYSEAVAAMAVDISTDVYNINWLYVVPAERMQGIGKMLVETLIDFAIDMRHVKAIEAVYDVSDISDVSESGLRDFFEALDDFDVSENLGEYVVDAETIHSSKTFNRMKKDSTKLVRYIDQTRARQQDYMDKISQLGIMNIWDPGCLDNMIPDLCLIKYKDGNITGLSLVLAIGEKELELSYLYSVEQSTTVEIISQICHVVAEKYSDYSIRIVPENEIAEKMVKQFFGEIEPQVTSLKSSWIVF